MPISQTVTLLSEEDVAAPAATSMNQAIPVGKRFISATLMRLAPGNTQHYITDHYENGGVLTVYFDSAPTILEHEVRFIWAEDFLLEEEITVLADNGDGTFTYTDEDGNDVTIDWSQNLNIAGSVISITNGNSQTLPGAAASISALTNRIASLEKCLARLCRTCPQPLNGIAINEE